MRVTAILNRDAGTMRRLDREAARAAVADALAGAGHAATVAVLPAADIGDAVRRAVAADAEAVVVGGGDGTASSAAAILAGTGVALGVLPLGTMNLTARSLGLPLDLEAAAAAVAVGRIVDADLAAVGDRPFLHQLSIGLQPMMVRLRERQGAYGSRLGKMLATARALRTVLRRPPVLALALDEDGRRHTVETAGLIVTNNPYGEGHLPYADDPATGLLGLYDVRSSRWTDLVQLVAEILWGTWQRDRNVAARTAAAVTIAAAGGGGPASLAATVDGELVRLDLPFTVTKRTKALRLIAAPDQAERRSER